MSHPQGNPFFAGGGDGGVRDGNLMGCGGTLGPFLIVFRIAWLLDCGGARGVGVVMRPGGRTAPLPGGVPKPSRMDRLSVALVPVLGLRRFRRWRASASVIVRSWLLDVIVTEIEVPYLPV